ncbi:hypothetical protein I3843_10G047000 [Carya illinoinensis]|uniref:Wings apart-like protein C-terminal domain-containing protein n=4 Tax=Carya illinoinensis TaxID=32201 RepID=A0A922DUP4_CARIL|nr:wings apart-like protein 1 [Carya illinoinensis]KAG6691064.1 hypothetical protein I3842_10G046100 [Carya illinoinensis]KAG7958956.1 hypothetical protein I3843_10G047000 [Carya illinoinensis]
MIVRTYGRRNRGIQRPCSSDTLNDAVDDDSFKDSLSQESPLDHGLGLYSGFAFSSQDSSSLHWASDSDPYAPSSSPALDDSINGAVGRPKKPRRVGRKRKPDLIKNCTKSSLPATSTLMEAQEFGEMMEHVDEVNFALDGLRKGQPVRIRRASLLSLLSICATTQQRRLLRTQGMAKTIVDAILDLSFDDSPSNLAAAALFCVLASDGQDDHLLESPNCIRFLIKLLKPMVSMSDEDKAPKIGRKLLSLCNVADICRDKMKRLDSSYVAIVSKVQEVLASCKELKSSCADDGGIGRLELCPKWIALLTMEKACLTTVSLEETTGAVRKTRGNFKEKLRELGGLDAVFEVIINCHSDMEGWMEHSAPSNQDAKTDLHLQSPMQLLKCLKIMENATFLSTNNQSHLLGMRGNLDPLGTLLSFIEVIVNLIKILSGLYLLRRSSAASKDEKSCNLPNGTGHASELALIKDCKVDSIESFSINSSRKFCSTERTSSQKSFNVSGSRKLLPSTREQNYCISSSETTGTSVTDTYSLKMRVNSSMGGLCSGTSRGSNSGILTTDNGSSKHFGLGKRPNFTEDAKLELEDSEDPFAFDEDEFEPSKWDVLSGKQKTTRTRKSGVSCREPEDGCQAQILTSQQELSNGDNNHSHELSCLSAVDEVGSSLLADCLLTAVKVLMNLTNDNPVGCRQIAAYGGLETMSSLIAGHFPSFSSSSSPSSEMKENSSSSDLDHQNDRHLTDQELDFLVAILGLLVNLVEKDGHNRSRLAAASVRLPSLEGLVEESHRDVIPLLCSIFLANQGAGEGAGEGNHLTLNDEAAVLQGEQEAEKMIVEAYAALLLAFLSTESKTIRDAIADCLPNRSLTILVPVLERFVAFHLTLNMISPETHKAVSEVIESCRIP